VKLTNHIADYIALREANNRLRQTGVETIWNAIESARNRLNHQIQPGGRICETGRQTWEFELEHSTLIGERLGLRLSPQTVVFEIGWPRLPEHGHVPGGGLARGRVGFSQNIMLEPQPVANIILRRDPSGLSARWFTLELQEETGLTTRSGEELTDSVLNGFFSLLTT